MTEQVTVPDIRVRKRSRGAGPIVMITAYDTSFARVVDQADVDIILVGDSLAEVVLGWEDTLHVGIEDRGGGTLDRVTAAADRHFGVRPGDPGARSGGPGGGGLSSRADDAGGSVPADLPSGDGGAAETLISWRGWRPPGLTRRGRHSGSPWADWPCTKRPFGTPASSVTC